MAKRKARSEDSLKQKVRSYNDGKWTEGRYRAFITSTLRSGTRRWPPKHQVLAGAKQGERQLNPATGRLAQLYECKMCKGVFSSRDIQIDHIKPVVDPKKGFVSWDVYIDRLFCEAKNMQALCRVCHKEKTKKERM